MTKPEQSFVAVQLDAATLARVDALVTQLSKDRPVTQSDVLRTLLRLALDEVQKDPGRSHGLTREEMIVKLLRIGLPLLEGKDHEAPDRGNEGAS